VRTKDGAVRIAITDSRVLLEFCGTVSSLEMEVEIEWQAHVTARAVL